MAKKKRRSTIRASHKGNKKKQKRVSRWGETTEKKKDRKSKKQPPEWAENPRKKKSSLAGPTSGKHPGNKEWKKKKGHGI